MLRYKGISISIFKIKSEMSISILCLQWFTEYCKRTYYRGVIFTRICIFGSVRGYEIPRNPHTLNT